MNFFWLMQLFFKVFTWGFREAQHSWGGVEVIYWNVYFFQGRVEGFHIGKQLYLFSSYKEGQLCRGMLFDYDNSINNARILTGNNFAVFKKQNITGWILQENFFRSTSPWYAVWWRSLYASLLFLARSIYLSCITKWKLNSAARFQFI